MCVYNILNSVQNEVRFQKLMKRSKKPVIRYECSREAKTKRKPLCTFSEFNPILNLIYFAATLSLFEVTLQKLESNLHFYVF